MVHHGTAKRAHQSVIRITNTLKDASLTIKVDGRLVSGETVVLVEACGGHRGPLVVDLSDLHFADDAGIAVLRELKAQGARIVRARPYLALQLADREDPIGGSQ
jgi:hypothetical protein